MSEAQKLPLSAQLSISGLSGCAAWLLTHPFENLKNRIMKAPPNTPISQTVAEVSKSGFYKGLSGGINRQIVYATVRLGCYEPFRDIICRDPKNPNVMERAAAGASAAGLASVLTSPIEVCLVLQTSSSEKVGFITAGMRVMKQSGILGFWRGLGALTSRAVVVGICQVAMYDQASSFLRAYNTNNNKNWSKNQVFVYASGFTALFYSFVTMPIELARVRMSSQLGNTNLKYKSVLQTIATIAKEEGVLAIYESFVPYSARCSIHTISCFFIMEQLTRVYWSRAQGSQKK